MFIVVGCVPKITDTKPRQGNNSWKGEIIDKEKWAWKAGKQIGDYIKITKIVEYQARQIRFKTKVQNRRKRGKQGEAETIILNNVIIRPNKQQLDTIKLEWGEQKGEFQEK